MQDTFATKDVAERIGVSETTVKTWADKLGLDVNRDSRHGRRFTQAEIDLLHTVRGLRDDGKGYQTITRLVGRAPDERQTIPAEQLTHDSQAPGERHEPDLDALAERITATVTASVISTIAGSTGLAEKYAHAAHRIGELEADVRHLTEKAQGILTTGTTEADRLRLEVTTLRGELAAERAKPWWRRALGQ